MRIIIVKRARDYTAHLHLMPEVCGYGQSPAEALGSLIYLHPDLFDIAINEEVDA